MEEIAVIGLMVLTISFLLLLAFLGDRTAAGLQRLARDWKEAKKKASKGKTESEDPRAPPTQKEDGR